MSDMTDLSIVIILLFGYTLYVFFVRKTIDALYDINNIKCNPVNLFLKSINADTNDSIDNFAECVQLLGPKTSQNTPTPSPSPAPQTVSAATTNPLNFLG